MQLNNKALLYTTSTNEFSEVVKTLIGDLKCAILKQTKSRDDGNSSHKYDYDMVIITTARAYSPYSLVFADDSIRIDVEGIHYRIIRIPAIKDFSGKTKYYEIYLSEIKT